MTAVANAGRAISVTFEPEWDADTAHAGRTGFFALDPRVRTLLRVLLSYPEVRYIVHDRIMSRWRSRRTICSKPSRTSSSGSAGS